MTIPPAIPLKTVFMVKTTKKTNHSLNKIIIVESQLADCSVPGTNSKIIKHNQYQKATDSVKLWQALPPNSN